MSYHSVGIQIDISTVYMQMVAAERRSNRSIKRIAIASSLFVFCALAVEEKAWAAIPTPILTSKTKRAKKLDPVVFPVFEKSSDPYSSQLSPDAVQLANTLNLTDKLVRLKDLKQQRNQFSSGTAIPVELRQDISECKLEIIEIIEQTRLDIDFVLAEIDEEQANIEEVLSWYTEERDDRVDRANIWSFRTNGILWAACEGLAIPTYSKPKLAIPSGVLGIVAGLVPSVFSAFAVRSGDGRHHSRRAHPNMLCKIYDLPTTARTEYPNSVWTHLNLPPASHPGKSRRQILMEHWVHNENIGLLKNGINSDKTKLLSGVDQSDVTIDLMNDRMSMLREVRACVLHMTRPLLELHMCLRDKKQIDG